jgi:CHAT domain-containing protein
MLTRWVDRPLAEVLDSATAVYFTGEELVAKSLLDHALERARAAGDVRAEARALTYLGLVAWRRFEWDESERLGVRALELKTEHGITDDLFNSHNALGLLRWNQNRFPDAARHFGLAIEWAEQSPRPHAAVAARQNLGLVQVEWGQFSAAREGFLAMRDSMLTIGDRVGPEERARGLGAALTNLGMLENRVGNPAAAVDWLTEAAEVYRNGFPPYEVRALGHLAVSYSALGRSAEAFETIQRAIELAQELGDLQEEASNLEVLAEHYRASGDFRRALETYAEAGKINARIDETVATGADLRGEAEIHLELGAPERARTSADEALRLHREAGATYEEFHDHLTLAVVAQELSDPEGVGRHLAQARRIAAALGVRSVRIALGLTEAALADRRAEPAAVLEALAEIEPEVGRGGYDEQWRAHHLASRAYRRLGRLDRAAMEGRRAVETIERVRSSYASGLLRTSFASDKREVYADQVTTLLESGRTEEALSVSDAARARALQEAAPVDPDGRETDASEMRLREIDGVVETIELIENGTMSWGGEVDVAALDELYRRLEELRSRYEADGEGGREVSPADLDVGRLASRMPPDERIVEYFVPAEGPVRIFVVGPDGLTVLESDLSSENLRSRVRILRELLSDRGASLEELRPLLAGLNTGLIRPVAEAGLLEGVVHLDLVPHDVLAYVPPSAWIDPETGRLLGEDFTLRILPAIAVGPGHPAQPAGERKATALAPLTDELPATRDEAMAVGAATGAITLVDGQATERALRFALGRDDLVHVATHGFLNTRNPLFSRIVLSDGSVGGSRDDGRLEVHELLELRRAPSLVFLSGCQTAAGRLGSTRFAPGEDYLTLAQAFLRAGAGAVVATLWRVDDRAAAVFARHFYEALPELGPSAALMAAQAAMRADEAFAAPYFWAGYQLFGVAGGAGAERP